VSCNDDECNGDFFRQLLGLLAFCPDDFHQTSFTPPKSSQFHSMPDKAITRIDQGFRRFLPIGSLSLAHQMS
jgi:hypothetical protein